MLSLELLAISALPPVLCIFVGLFAARLNIMPHSSIGPLNTFVLKICMSCLLFDSIYTFKYSSDLFTFGITVLLFKLLCFIYAVILSLLLTYVRKGARIPFKVNLYCFFSSTCWTNSIVLGLPIVADLFEAQSSYGVGDLTKYVIVSGIIDYLLMMPTGCVLLDDNSEGLKSVPMLLLKNPPVVSIVIGLCFLIFNIPLHPIVNNTLLYFAHIVKGAAHFVCGMSFDQILRESPDNFVNNKDRDYLLINDQRNDGNAEEDQQVSSKFLGIDSEIITNLVEHSVRIITNPSSPFFISPLLMFMIARFITHLNSTQELLAVFVACLPVSLSAFVLAKNYEKCVGALNRVVVIGNFLLTPLLFLYVFIFDWELPR
ncbi:hypothetical protein GEMRC1_003088 [Eukaryota sp. GEM-RC1]